MNVHICDEFSQVQARDRAGEESKWRLSRPEEVEHLHMKGRADITEVGHDTLETIWS